MARARSNGIELEYEVIGNPGDPALLLIMGLGAQLITWDDELVLGLARRGHFVIRFDNRDVGLSTHLDGAPAPSGLEVIARRARGEPLGVAYTLSDMADDTAGLLDHLELSGAHVLGASLGGMVAQTLAIAHPRRVRSLTSIMSTTGNPSLPPAKPEAMARLGMAVPSERGAYIEHSLTTQRIVAGTGFPFDEERGRRLAGRLFDRAFYPQGVLRQIAAAVASGSRREALEALRVPTLVVHGLEDPLVPVEGGLDTHEAIAGSELLLIDGMGHSLPRGVWPSLIDAVQKHVARAS
ncbi:MAG TPA: alpha/beta fold hydrolase [Myxococcota bacterium]|nr:alpha/beta fold hydrolase [Myxococcota bacterium]